MVKDQLHGRRESIDQMTSDKIDKVRWVFTKVYPRVVVPKLGDTQIVSRATVYHTQISLFSYYAKEWQIYKSSKQKLTVGHTDHWGRPLHAHTLAHGTDICNIILTHSLCHVVSLDFGAAFLRTSFCFNLTSALLLLKVGETLSNDYTRTDVSVQALGQQTSIHWFNASNADYAVLNMPLVTSAYSGRFYYWLCLLLADVTLLLGDSLR